jgi:hypothetical protein
MYKQRDDIEKLIDSLTAGEKRHFTGLYTPNDATEELPLFLQLYLVHEKGKSQLLDGIKSFGSRSLTSAKRRLYDNILASLLTLHRDESNNTILQNQLSAIELLYSKGLPEQTLIIWTKAYGLATEHEKFNLLLQLLDWEKRLNIVLDTPTRDQEAIKDEENTIILKLQQILTLERLYSHIMVFKKQHGFAKGTLRSQLEAETVHSTEMPAEGSCLSLKAQFYYDLIYSVYYWMTFDHQKGYEHSKRLLSLPSENILSRDFLNGILQHITSSVCLAKFRDTLNGILLGNAFLEEHSLIRFNTFKSLMFAYQSTYRLIAYGYMGDRASLLSVVKQTETQLKEYESFIPMDLRKILNGNLMNAYMAAGNQDKADELWDMLMNHKQFKKVREDINGDLYLFRLFSLLQAKRYALLPSAALSAYRYYNKSEDADSLYPLEITIAKLLRKERDYEHFEVLREVLEVITSTVNKFISSHGVNGFQEHYSRYTIWADAILHEEPYYLASQRWYAGFKKGVINDD